MLVYVMVSGINPADLILLNAEAAIRSDFSLFSWLPVVLAQAFILYH
jgi:hypothetical protein